MLDKINLDPADSDCEKNQKIIVSKDNGERRTHKAMNPGGGFDVRHYRLDGNLVQNQTCCDFLLLNDTGKKAYFIELKGQNVKRAVEQLLAGEALCKDNLEKYEPDYRIVASKSRTHDLQPNNFRKLLAQVGPSRLLCRTTKM